MMPTTIYAVDGMTCDHCVRAVTTELTSLPDVSLVDVDLGSGAVAVTSTTALERQAVEDAVDRAGCSLGSTSRL
jgi:copper chaperone